MRVSMPDRRSENALLLAFARTAVDSRRQAQIRALLRGDMDWSYLLRMAGRHGVLSLFYSNLMKNSFAQLVPEPILDRFRSLFLANLARNIHLTEELIKTLDAFEAHQIPAIPFKGPSLACAAYGDLTLRVFSDLDILVPRQDVLRAKALLLSRGYQLQFSLPPPQEADYLRSHSEYYFARKENRTLIEVQWKITPRDFIFFIDSGLFWQRAERLSLNGKMVRTFAPKDLITFLSVHGAVHCWERLIWVADLAELLRVHERIDREELIDHADQMGCRRFLLLGLSLAHDLRDTPLSRKVREKIQAERGVQALARGILENLFRERDATGGILQHSWFYFRIHKNWADRVFYCSRLFFTPTVADWRSLPLPPSLSPLYYLLHPLRIAGKCFWKLLMKGSVSFLSLLSLIPRLPPVRALDSAPGFPPTPSRPGSAKGD